MNDSPVARSPYLEGNYAPIHSEIDAACEVVAGEIPADLEGMFVRNGSNPRFIAEGRYHWFDGDGMLHGIQFRDRRAVYHNRWVRTRAFVAEEEAGRALWTGVTERPDFTNPRGPFKDTSNTDLVYHAGRLLTLWWLGGEPYVVRLPDLCTLGPTRFGTEVKTVSAHPKVDAVTGEMMFFDYKPFPPYLSYGVLSPSGELSHFTTIDLPGPRLQHDMAITERYSIFFDMSMRWDEELLATGRTKVRFYRDRPSRIGVLPRHAKGDQIRWFDCSPFYMYHTINAWEEDGKIVILGCRIDNPLSGDPENPTSTRPVPSIGFLRLEPELHRWTLELASGAVKEERIDSTPAEFPRMDNRILGRRSRYAYDPRIAPASTLLFDGVIKYDTDTDQSQVHEYPKGAYGGEVVFAPRAGSTAEDDGYLLTFVVDDATGVSEMFVIDARDVTRKPVARVRIPQRVPTGYHAWWVSGEELNRQRVA